MASNDARKTGQVVPTDHSEPTGTALGLRRGFLIADKLWQPHTDVAGVNRLMKDPAFRGLYETSHFVPASLRLKKLLPLLPRARDDLRIDQFADWFLSHFQEVTGCLDGSGHPAVQAFLRSYSGGPSNAYLRGQTFALSTPDAEYWEGYGIRKGVLGPHAWNRLGGKVLDLTWHQGRANPATVYLGVPIGTDFLQWSKASGGPVAFLNWAKRQQDGKN